MPIYEYRCENCGHQFEIIQKFADSPLELCEKCQGHLNKLISQTSFQFKGTGWYVTDYANKSGKSTPTETKSESKKESAPAACSKPSGG